MVAAIMNPRIFMTRKFLSWVVHMDNLFGFHSEHCTHLSPSDVEKKSARYGRPHRALSNAPREDVRKVAQNLSPDNHYSQPPPPPSPLKPTHPSKRQCHREQHKQETDWLPQS